MTVRGLALAFLLVLPTIAPADDVLRVTLDDALARFRAQSPELVAAALRVRAAGADVTSARLLPNPVVSTGVGNLPLGRTNPPRLGVGDTVVATVGAEQEVPLWGRRSARIAVAREREAVSDAQRADLERTLAFEVRARFVALLEASERLRLAHENLDRYRDTVRVTASRAREGEIAPAELDKVALEQRGFEREVADAELDRREAVAALAPLLGSPAADVEPVGELGVPGAREDVDALVAEALAHRPDLRAAERARDSADAALRLARASRWPNVTVGLQYTHSEFQVSGDLANTLGTSLSVPLPVFDRNQGEIARAEAEALIAARDVAALRIAIAQEVRSAATRYTVARDRIRGFEDGFLRQAAEARRAAEVSYREGAVSLLEFLEAERTYIQTARDRLAVLRDVNTAAHELTKAAALEE